MDVRELWAALSHRRCAVFVGEDGVPAIQRDRAEIVWFDERGLLMRVEDPAPALQPGAIVRLDVPREDGLYRVHGTVTSVIPRESGELMVYLDAQYGERIQQRSSERFDVTYPARFVPLREGDRVLEVDRGRYGVGRVVDISAGGMLFETTYLLPLHLVAAFQVFTPVGLLEMEGEIVSALEARGRGPGGERILRYGIKFAPLDENTQRRLHKLLFNLERATRELAAEEEAAAARARPLPGQELAEPRLGLTRRLRRRRPRQAP